MTDDQALLAAIIANRDDDTPRLVFADCLQENGQEERAEFIRVQCALESLYNTTTRGQTRKIDRLLRRQRKLLAKNDQQWFCCYGGITGSISRGFLSTVICKASDFISHADAIVWHPTQTMVCPKCNGKGWETSPDGCSGCRSRPAVRGSGEIPRPMPTTAQPIAKVTLTTRPNGRWECDGRPSAVAVFHLDGYPRTITETEVLASRKARGTWDGTPHDMKHALEAIWKGIEFGVPPFVAQQYGHAVRVFIGGVPHVANVQGYGAHRVGHQGYVEATDDGVHWFRLTHINEITGVVLTRM